MNKCKRFKNMISDYIEGKLIAGVKTEFESHLHDCPSCFKVVSDLKNLRNILGDLKLIQTSPDFETVLRTRMKIESGIGRHRLHEIIWSWPTKIPVYGMSVALIIIAIVLVIQQVNKSTQTINPDAYINKEWYGGNPIDNSDPSLLYEGENVIYVIERTSPEKLFNNNALAEQKDSTIQSQEDSSSNLNKQMTQVNQIIY